ncbi:2-iminoacetate synthase ThiH [Peptacetobacter hominis]|uniref:2-iminoacetate synthase ThiH n=1 Tax=Peptacetobacter hominis TaxID=2743610 RepID=A0A544QXB6_9FIRM|nr:2-iminoacetate synthase ThiH [Peptacetobacter hominis]TQQ85306.1 2-iminoacetate synthase ThiH [Peptacetobacter hominis]
MSFYEVIEKYRDFDFDEYWKNVTDDDVKRSIAKHRMNHMDVLNLLSPAAERHMEEMAQKAHKESVQNFGKTVTLYTPMYIANYCENHCLYCGYNCHSGIKRKKLNLEEIDLECQSIAEQGFKHILILTGESEKYSSIEYIGDAVKCASKYFPSIGIEVYPMSVEGYKHLVSNGAEGLTVYQETYNEEMYQKVHIKGPKANYKWRLDAPERGAMAGMRTLTLGALLGLYKWREDAFFTILHGEYLKDKYPYIELSYSAPRIRPFKGCFEGIMDVTDRNMVQAMLAMRLFDPHAGLNVSTRENLEMRRNIMPFGVTKISAGVSTDVGGHSQNEHDTAQFEVNHDCEVKQVTDMLKSIGYQHVFKDWNRFEYIHE